MVAGIAAIAMSFALLAGCNPGDDATATDTTGSSGTEQAAASDPEEENKVDKISEDDTVVTVLDTAVDIAWDKGATVEAEKLTTAEDTSRFVVTYTSNSDTDYHKFKMALIDCSLELHEGKEGNIKIDRSSSNTDDLHGCSFVTKPSATEATFSYQPTADEWKSIKTGGFNIYGHGAKITKIELVTPKDGTVATPTKDNIAETKTTTSATMPESAYKAYTVTTTTAVEATEFGLKLQLDNDGTQDANGLTIEITDFEVWVKIGDNDGVLVSKSSLQLTPSQYDGTPYSKTNTRFVLDGLSGTIASGTKVQIMAVKGTVDNSEKAGSIVFALQQEGGAYDMLAADSEMWKPIFAAKE